MRWKRDYYSGIESWETRRKRRRLVEKKAESKESTGTTSHGRKNAKKGYDIETVSEFSGRFVFGLKNI